MELSSGTVWSKSYDLLRRLEIDHAVFFGLFAKLWTIIAGPVTLVLIARKFSPEIQGYYFTFATIVALQVFVELGLGTVIVQFAGHEWASLSLDGNGRIAGDRVALARLTSLAAIASRWYCVGSILFTAGLATCGYMFLSSAQVDGVHWAAPWLSLCILSGLNLLLVPVWSLLEGCNQVAKLYTFRFVQGVLSAVTLWVAVLFNASLWTASIGCVVTITSSICYLRWHHADFVKTLLLTESGKTNGKLLTWRHDLLPLQWRIAITMITSYFVFTFFVPVAFKFKGPVVAGQIGMTWAAINALGNLSFSWFTPKVPRLCALIAAGKYEERDKLFFHNIAIVMVLLLGAGMALWGGIWVINHLGLAISKRLLPPGAAGIFIAANMVLFASSPFSQYMRAHKREPIVFVVVCTSVLTGISTLMTGKYGSMGLMMGNYLIINFVATAAIVRIWFRFRAGRRWGEDNEILPRQIRA